MKILSLAPTGSGAWVLHRQLQATIPGYELRSYSPRLEYFPPALGMIPCGDADVLHAVAEHGVFFRRRGLPQVLTLHGYNLDPLARHFSTPLQRVHYATDLRWFMRMSLSRAERVIAVSRFTADVARNDLGLDRPIDVIPNGVDVERFRPVATGGAARKECRVLFCGNLTRRKGADLLPFIAKHLLPDVRIHCATGLRSGPAGWDNERIVSLGKLPAAEMPALYGQFDMLLMPSRREGLSLTLLEAMACGLPVVATDAASFPEVVHEEKGGFLCPPGDVVAFAERINRLCGDAALRKAMGDYNRALVETSYSAVQMAERYRAVFEEVR